jgi:diguanylate cyclase (GGDEF)-like protein
LNVAIRRANRDRSMLALLFLDIDHFKTVNDTLGHEAGDDLLRSFALTLQSSMRNSDTVARLAGDEFTIVLEAVGSVADALHVAQKLVDTARKTVGWGDGAIEISTSIGVAMLGPHDNAASLLRRADEALYEAKRLGRNRFVCAEAGVAEPVSEQPMPG